MEDPEPISQPVTNVNGHNISDNISTSTCQSEDSAEHHSSLEYSSPADSDSRDHVKPDAVNGLSSEAHDDALLSEIDQMVTRDHEELSSLRQENSRLESANQRLEEKLTQISLQKEEEVKGYRQSLCEVQGQKQALEKTVANQLGEINMWKERVETNDKAARKAIAGYKAEHLANMDKVTKKYNECLAEKEAMVVKYAQGETKIVQLQSNIDKLELRVKEKEREKEVLADKLRTLKSESAKKNSNTNSMASELSALKKELESQKEAISSHEYRAKWAQNKLKSELDSHKETKGKLEEVTRKLKESKEECVTIRTSCQQMIKTYQESEDIKSNSLDIELKKKEVELKEKSAAVDELTQNLKSVKDQLEGAVKDIDILRKQSGAGEEKVEELEKTNTIKVKELDDLKACVFSLREENSQIRSKLGELQTLKQELESKKTECEELEGQVTTAAQSLQEHNTEMEVCKKREGDMLELTQKMTQRNAELQSENLTLKSKLQDLENISSQQLQEISALQESIKQKERQWSEETSQVQSERSKAQAEIEQQSKTLEGLNADIEAYQVEIRMLKKKQVSSVKELTREVHTLKRQLEAYESKHLDESVANASTSSAGRHKSPTRRSSPNPSIQHSRANSTSSLDKEGWTVVERQQTVPENSKPPTADPPAGDSLEPQFLEPDKQKMIEKIVKLQKLNARKNEKLDFCQEHIHQLVEEVQKKTRIIQMYAMKDQAGALSSDAMEQNKNALAKKGGIMASISNQQAKDDSLNLKLSLKINNQLQALLEDTLLKNITLKENMDTLGAEIEKQLTVNSELREQISRLEGPLT